MPPRARVIIDNDFAGDPDGLFQLAHHMLCTSVEVLQVIASRVPDGMVAPGQDFIGDGVEAADEVLALVGSTVVAERGPAAPLSADHPPEGSPAVQRIIREALREDTALPLYFAAGAGLTSIASALALEPRIADRLTLVWIGGHGYDEDGEAMEFNTACDPVAAQRVFGSAVAIWQVPEPSYAQCLVSWAELERDVAAHSELGAHLVRRWKKFTNRVESMFGADLGECAVLGDSPLVLLTALQGTFRAAPSSSPSVLEPRRGMRDDGTYGPPIAGLPPVRVFTGIDTRLMYGDLVARLATRPTVTTKERP